MDNLKCIIPGKPEYMTMIRLATSSIAAQAGFDVDQAEDIKIAVVEACKNISCHGKEGYSEKYEIEYTIGQGTFGVTVVDACDKSTLEKVSQQCQNCPQEGDIGMILLHSLMTTVNVGKDEQGHKFIQMVKSL